MNIFEKGYFSDNAHKDMVDEYQLLKNNILLSAEDGQKTMMVLSSTEKEGSSTVALNLAAVKARYEKTRVAFVDMNIRNSFLNKHYSDGKGLIDLILEQAEFDQVLKETNIRNLTLVPAGTALVDPPRFFGSPGLKAFFKKLKERVDFIIVDVPPVNQYPDALLLAAYVDAAVIVISSNKTRRAAILKAKEKLEKNRIPILGVVLNKTKHQIPDFIYKRL